MRQINTSDFFSLSFDKSLNDEMQDCWIDVTTRFWNDSTKLVERRYYDQKFLHCQNANELWLL